MDDDEVSFPWSWRAALVLTGDWVASVLDESADYVRNLSIRVAADYNHRVNQRNMHEQMARELETIMEESE